MNANEPGSAGNPVMFMSYAHHDDREGGLRTFRDRLLDELHSLTGRDVPIFKDDDTELGQSWREVLNEGLTTSTFLLPIITPSFLTSPYCREEFETFSAHEEGLARNDLVLPIYYIDCGDFLIRGADEKAAATLRTVLERQYFDWRRLRLLTPSHQSVRTARNELATGIREAMARAATQERVSRLTVAEKADREAAVEGGGRHKAKLILRSELRKAQKVLQKEILERGEWPAGRETRWLEAWATYHPDVADAMGEDYGVLSEVFEYVGRLQDGLKTGPRPFAPSDATFLDESREAIDRGISLLSA